MPLGANEGMTKLTKGKIQQIIRRKKLDCRNDEITAEMNVSKRRVQQVWSAYGKSGELPQLRRERRPRRILTEIEKAAIEKSYKEVFLGARMLRYHIRRHCGMSIPHNKIHEYLLERDYASENHRRKKQRKRCRYERRYSLSLVHTDWLVYKRRKAIGYTDDASRKLLALGEFKNATWLNSVGVLKIAEEHAERFNGQIYALNSDRGSQFCVNTTPGYKVESRFQKYLKTRGIQHIPSRVKNPQTNGKMERWVREYKKHRDRFKSSEEFMEWYNNRLHGALDLENAETPNEAFLRKLRPEALLGMFLRNFEDGLYALKDM